MEDKEEDDALGSGRGSPKKLLRHCGLAGADVGARVLAVPGQFFPWVFLEPTRRWNGTAGHVRGFASCPERVMKKEIWSG
uniref:Uncharacterized protein n=1 Tax=Oryza punctata TaxID=4537 RepID=A0A0E0LHC2_ORYPU